MTRRKNSEEMNPDSPQNEYVLNDKGRLVIGKKIVSRDTTIIKEQFKTRRRSEIEDLLKEKNINNETTVKSYEIDYTKYKTNTDRVAEIGKRKTQITSDIGTLWPPVNPDKRNDCEFSLYRFCMLYLKHWFPKPFGKNHYALIEDLERVIQNGGQCVAALPRGEGKSTLNKAACLWALLYKKKKYIVLIAANTELAIENLYKPILTELQSNNDFLYDFSETVYPIACLANAGPLAASKQLSDGTPTHVVVKVDQLSTPFDNRTILSKGISSGYLGLSKTTAKQEVFRPDLVLIDDPQTSESASSPTQCEKLWNIIHNDIMGLGGPGEPFTCLCTLTVIKKGDLGEMLLDRERAPLWKGSKKSWIMQWPTNMNLWEKYCEIYKEDIKTGGDGSKATKFYESNREAMDLGAEVSWEERKLPKELSSLESAFRLRCIDEYSFSMKYQNEPTVSSGSYHTVRTIRGVVDKTFRGSFDYNKSKYVITASLDIQERILYWIVVAWEKENMGGYVIDYGMWPDHPRVCEYSQIKKTLQSQYISQTIEQSVELGIIDCVKYIKEKYNQDFTFVDAGDMSGTVYNSCEILNKESIPIMPVRGIGIKAAGYPIESYKFNPRDRWGTGWYIKDLGTRRKRERCVNIDVNYWKTHIHKALSTPEGDRSLWLPPGKDNSTIGSHIVAEFPTETYGQGRTLLEWSRFPGKDNHLLDCLTYSACCASFLGAGFQHKRAKPLVTQIKRKNNSWEDPSKYKVEEIIEQEEEKAEDRIERHQDELNQVKTEIGRIVKRAVDTVVKNEIDIDVKIEEPKIDEQIKDEQITNNQQVFVVSKEDKNKLREERRLRKLQELQRLKQSNNFFGG